MKPHHGALDEFIIRCLESGKYRVDQDGVIWNVDFRGCGIVRRVRQYKTKQGYWVCMLRCGGARDTRVTVHRVVALSFHRGHWSQSHDVDHIDGDKSNNAASNLEFVDRRENVTRAWRLGLKTPSGKIGLRGENHHMAKLTAEQAREVHRRLDAGELQRVVAADFGLCQSHVSAIASGKSWPEIYREFHP